MDDTSELGDSVVPVYEFSWQSHSRTTDEIEDASTSAVEMLAQLGREDPECEVALVGYTN